MKRLEPQFTYDGFAFRLLERMGDVAILEKSKPHHPSASYEVVIVQRHPAQSIHGRDYPARESMPPSESWGALGWSLASLADAKRKSDQLVTTRAEAACTPTPFPADESESVGRL